jgi:hypothetical protein
VTDRAALDVAGIAVVVRCLIDLEIVGTTAGRVEVDLGGPGVESQSIARERQLCHQPLHRRRTFS